MLKPVLLILAFITTWLCPLRFAIGGETGATSAGSTLVYKRVDGRELKLFVDKLEGWQAADHRPAIVFFFGGGWVAGTPNQFLPESEYFARRGMVGIRVEYRTIPKGDKGPPIICCADAKSAMRYVRSHAADLGIDPRRIAAAGGSAGGHLAAFTALVNGLDDPHDDLAVSCKPEALLLWNPVYNNGPGNWGHERVGDRYKEFSPADNITSNAPPTIVFLGTQDKLIPQATAKSFQAEMERCGVRCETRFYEGQEHGFFNKEPWLSKTLAAANQFLTSLGWLEKPAVKSGVTRRDPSDVIKVAHVITSPDAQTRVEISEEAGQLSYSVQWQGETILQPSRLDVFDGGKMAITSVETNESDHIWQPVWGQFSEVRDHYLELMLRLNHGAREDVLLECRVFNDGVGLRFTSGGKVLAGVGKVNFLTEYRWPEKSAMYWPQGEHEPVGPISVAAFAGDLKLSPMSPVVVDAGAGIFAAVLESDLFSAKQFSTVRFGHADAEAAVLVAKSAATVRGEAWQTPWRVLLLGRSPGDLLVSTTPLNLAAKCELADTSWIKPGKTLWDWRVHGYQAGNFRYGINTASYLRFIDFAATNNIQYFLIDDAWFTSAQQGKLEPSPAIDLPTIMAHARERGVKILLYYDHKKGVLQDSVLFPQLAQLGAVGVKYGFMGDNAGFTRGAITASAKQKLLIDFHDNPCPMTGVERTMPNMMAREYCHSELDGHRALTPTEFLKTALINALVGPMDQQNGNFGLNGINTVKRDKGLAKLGSYESTVVSETARVLVIASGLICLPDAPEEYAKKADLFDFIRRMPATWDETRILNSRIGEYITTARRSGKEWFVGSVINEAGGELSIPLDFLAPDTAYDVTYYEDAPDSDCVINREAYRIAHGTVKRGDTIKVRLAPGGGNCMWIRPQPQTNP